MAGVAVKIGLCDLLGFYNLTYREYNQAVQAWVKLNDPDGKAQAEAKRHDHWKSKKNRDEFDKLWEKYAPKENNDDNNDTQ